MTGSSTANEHDEAQQQIAALRADVDAAKADAEQAKAERNKNEAQWVEMQRAGDIRHLRKLTQEANEARAELAALKGRKVTLPPVIVAEDNSETGRRRAAVSKQRATVIVLDRSLVIAAIRAAGVEVEHAG